MEKKRDVIAMDELSTTIEICRVALSGGAKVVEKIKKRLSKQEKELLVAASGTGEFHYPMSTDQTTSWVRAGGIDFPKGNDPVSSALYIQAFLSLCERGYVQNESKLLFRLTAAGFKAAKKLEKRVFFVASSLGDKYQALRLFPAL